MRALVSVSALLALSAGGCASERTAQPPPNDQFIYPTGLVHLDGAAGGEGVLYVASANFDLKYRSGSLSAVDLGALPDLPAFSQPVTDETPVVDVTDLRLGAGQQAAIPNLSGLMDAYVRPGQPARLFVATRAETSQIAVVDADGAQLTCAPPLSGTDCVDSPLALTNGEAGGGGEYPAAPAPFGVTVDTLTPDNPRVWVTHMEPAYTAATERIRDVKLYLMNLDPRSVEANLDADGDVRDGAYRLLDLAREGGSGTAANAVAVAGPWAFITGRLTASGAGGGYVATSDLVRVMRRDLLESDYFDASGVPVAGPQDWPLGLFFANLKSSFSASESRGIAVSPSGRNIYVTTRAPDALLVLAIQDLNAPEPALRIERIVPLPDGAGEVRVIPRAGRGDLVAVSCSTAGALALYDADVGEVLGLVSNMGQDTEDDGTDAFEETYAMTVDVRADGPGGVPGARIFLASFDDDRVAVVDVKDLSKPQDARLVARLGKARFCPGREQGEKDCRTGGQK